MSDRSNPEKFPPSTKQDLKPKHRLIEASLAPGTAQEDTSQPLSGIRTELETAGEVGSVKSDESYKGYPLMWPSDDLNTLTNRIETTTSSKRRDVLRTLSLVAQVKLLHRHSKRSAYQENMMSMINGDEALVLADKVTFHGLVQDMGYAVPKQFVSDPARTAEENRELVEETFPDPSQQIFCKPVTGGGGRGASIIPAQDIDQFLSEHPDYILQEKIPVEKEFRYIRQIDHTNKRIWRIAYERVKPTVVGDGKSSVWHLIQDAPMPFRMKFFASLGNASSLRDIPGAGELRELSVAANPPKGSYEELPSDQEVANLDKFMERFTRDLEERVGSELPTLCFDLGVTDKTVLEGAYDFERMKEAIVPFECQMPFSSLAYFAKLKGSLKAGKAMAGFHRTMSRERNK
ncbi:MAG TPA: hypothetical protein VJC10_00235 [Patescibacteria group bacterium]|nr:hypothetical protein [Patescibacteria group bacterium]